MHALLFVNRIALGWYMLFAGWNKVLNEWNEGFGTFLNGSFQNRVPGWLPDFIATPYGYALPWLELIFGALLFIGFLGRGAAIVTTLVLLSIAIALIGTGEFFPRHHVMVFLPIALLLASTGPGNYSLDGMLKRRIA